MEATVAAGSALTGRRRASSVLELEFVPENEEVSWSKMLGREVRRIATQLAYAAGVAAGGAGVALGGMRALEAVEVRDSKTTECTGYGFKNSATSVVGKMWLGAYLAILFFAFLGIPCSPSFGVAKYHYILTPWLIAFLGWFASIHSWGDQPMGVEWEAWTVVEKVGLSIVIPLVTNFWTAVTYRVHRAILLKTRNKCGKFAYLGRPLLLSLLGALVVATCEVLSPVYVLMEGLLDGLSSIAITGFIYPLTCVGFRRLTRFHTSRSVRASSLDYDLGVSLCLEICFSVPKFFVLQSIGDASTFAACSAASSFCEVSGAALFFRNYARMKNSALLAAAKMSSHSTFQNFSTTQKVIPSEALDPGIRSLHPGTVKSSSDEIMALAAVKTHEDFGEKVGLLSVFLCFLSSLVFPGHDSVSLGLELVKFSWLLVLEIVGDRLKLTALRCFCGVRNYREHIRFNSYLYLAATCASSAGITAFFVGSLYIGC